MANKTMHHAVIGADTFELIDEAGREETSQLKNALTAVEIVDTASGAIASFADGSNGVPVRDLTVQLEPIQDLHGQANPYPAGGGKNLFGGEYNTLFPLHFEEDTVITASGDTTSANNVAIRYFDSNQTQIDYYGLSSTYSSISGRVARSFTLPKEAYYVSFFNQESANYQIELGNTNTSYAPYSNVCPISGRTAATVTRTGKNIVKVSQDNEVRKNGGSYFTLDYLGDNTVRMNITSVAACYVIWEAFEVTKNLVGKSFTLSSDENVNMYWYKTANKDGSWTVSPISFPSSTRTVQITEDDIGRAFGVAFYNDSGTAKTITHIQVEVGSTATTFEPYKEAQTVTIQLGQTVYGGTLDVVNGELVIDMAIVDLGTLNWSYGESNLRFGASLSGILPQPVTTLPRMASDRYKVVTGAYFDSHTTESGIIRVDNSYARINVRDLSYSDVTAFTNAVTGSQLAYELAQPVTVQLTPQQLTTLLGQNNVWSDADSVSVDYVADTKLYIAKVIADALT